LLHLIHVLRGAQDNHIRQGDHRDLPVASVANRQRPPREAQLAIRDAGRAKEADLPLAVPEPIGRNARRDHRYRAQIYPNATSRDGFWCSFSPLEGLMPSYQ
jgi:hypothetical protein